MPKSTSTAWYLLRPEPVAETWINIRANSSKPDSSDSVADFGERWNIRKKGTDLFLRFISQKKLVPFSHVFDLSPDSRHAQADVVLFSLLKSVNDFI